MRSPANLMIQAILMLGLTSLACLSTGEVIGAIGEPIPMGTSVVPQFDSLAWDPAPAAPIGISQQVGSLTLTVDNVIRPANHIADDATFYTQPEPGQEYLAVDITVTCNLPAEEACYLSSADFGASGAQGSSYMAEIMTTGIGRALEGGELKGGSSRSGYLFFQVNRDDSGLVMQYPRLFGLSGQSGSFLIDD